MGYIQQDSMKVPFCQQCHYKDRQHIDNVQRHSYTTRKIQLGIHISIELVKYKADFVVIDGPCQPILGSKAIICSNNSPKENYHESQNDQDGDNA